MFGCKYNLENKMFKGKVVIITGSSSGIGAGIAIKFATEGAKGIVLHGRKETALQVVKEKCEKAGQGNVKVSVCVGDITDDNVRKNLIDKAISDFGQLDVLVNNAGIANGAGLCDTAMNVYDDIFNINVRSPMALCQLAVPHLLKTKGNIVNISSAAGLKASSVAVFYSSSKAALDHFTRCLSLELGPKGIRVNSINPGYVPETALIRHYAAAAPAAMEDDDMKKYLDDMVQKCPLRRVGKVEEIANAVAYMASDQATFVTGAIFPVDAGISLA